MPLPSRRACLAGFVLLIPASLCADEPEQVDYLRAIKPLLAERCYTCHGALQQKADLRLDTVKAMRAGGANGPAIQAGAAEKSALIAHVLGREGSARMPPPSEAGPLTDAQVALLRRWIDGGARAPADEQPEPDPRDHWAFRAPVRPPLPEMKQPASNPVDAFVAAEWTARGLTPQPLAERRLLLRRVYLDLIGLPPTREEQEAFLADTSLRAYERVVDRLLASPHYGERWGRHWMDIWRYSDWWGLGEEVRSSQKHMWHWRDWIVDSLNTDVGYDEMVREMLAADELYPNDLAKLRATGYLARQYFRFNRTTWLDETIEHTSKAFLGLTLNCAKCHDHKYDPLAQADYYRMRAFFEPYHVRVEQVAGELDVAKAGIPRAYDAHLEEPTYLLVRGDDRNPARERPLAPAVPRLLALGKLDIQPVTLPAEAHQPGLRPHVFENHRRLVEKKQAEAKTLSEHARTQPTRELALATQALAERTDAAATAQLVALTARLAADRAKAQHEPVAELAVKAAAAQREAEWRQASEELARAELELIQAAPDKKAEVEKKRETVEASLQKALKACATPGNAYTSLRGALKTVESPVETEEQRLRPFPETSTGRRTALARWITDRKNPLTARVAVNHIWARHFGKPLVESVFDFGRKGQTPTHPALLDYLAVEFMESGWSMKSLHRLMVTSELYRRSSSAAGADLKTRAADPANRYLWRMNTIRMEAQVVRDSLLHLAGDLDPKLGGPSIPIADEASRRRSLYFVHSNNEQQKFLSMFDDAAVRECYRRTESIVPQQALALSNSKLALAAAARVSNRIENERGPLGEAEFIAAAFELLLGTSPTAEERVECAGALREWRELAKGRADGEARARTNLVHALLNHNDFITVR